MPKNTNISKKHVAHLEQVRRQTQAIKITAIAVIVVVVGLVGYGILINSVLLPYRPVAVVNGEWVTVQEFQTQDKIQRLQLISQMEQYLQYAQMFGVSDPMNDQNFGPVLSQDYTSLTDANTLGQQVINQEIDDKLIRQEAKRRNIVVATADVDKALQESLRYYANGTPTTAPTLKVPPTPTLNPTELSLVTITPTPAPVTPSATATLDPSITPTATSTPTATATTGPTPTITPTSTPLPTATPYTLQGYQDLLKQQLTGVSTQAAISETDFRSFYESSVYRQKLEDVVTADLKPVEEEVWARHILVATVDEANAVIARLKKGEDFGKVAAEVSTDTGTAQKGGDLGWFGHGAMVKEFEDAAFTLKVGEISQPIKSQYGFHVIQVLGHEDRALNDTDFQKYKDQTFTDFLAKLKAAGSVQTYDDFWKSVIPTLPTLPPEIQQLGASQQQGLPTGP